MCDIQNWNSYIKHGVRLAGGCMDNYTITYKEGDKRELRSVNNGVLAQSNTMNRAQSEAILDFISDYSKAKSTGALILLYDQLLPACEGGLTLFAKKTPQFDYRQPMSVDGYDYLAHYIYKVTVSSGLNAEITIFNGDEPYCRIKDEIEISDEYSGLLAHRMLTAKLIHEVRQMREAESDKSEEFSKLCKYIDKQFHGRNTEEVFTQFAKFVNSNECSEMYTLKIDGEYITLFKSDEPLKVFYNPDKYELIREMYRYIWDRRDLLYVHEKLEYIPHKLELDKSLLRIDEQITINNKSKRLLMTATFNDWDRDITVTVSEPNLPQMIMCHTEFRYNEESSDYGRQPDRTIGVRLAILHTIERIGAVEGDIIEKLKSFQSR